MVKTTCLTRENFNLLEKVLRYYTPTPSLVPYVIEHWHDLMETRTVKPPKALPNTFRKEMPALVIANKHSQGKKDLGDLKYITFHIAHSPSL